MTFGFEIAMAIFVLGVLFMIVEVASPSFGFAILGSSLIIIGLLAMFFPLIFDSPISVVIMFLVAIGSMAASIYFYSTLGENQEVATTITESFVGMEGILTTAVVPNSLAGKIKIKTQVWSATADVPIPVGTRVLVTAWEGVHVIVEEVKAPDNTLGNPDTTHRNPEKAPMNSEINTKSD